MSAEAFLRSDYFDSEVIFRFIKPNSSHKQDLSTSPTLTSPLICKDLTTEHHKIGVFSLHGKLLIYFEDEKATSPKAVLDLSYSRLKKLSLENDDESYGFMLAKSGKGFTFYSKDEEIIETWITALKTICILPNFHEQYSASKMIGKGSFAKVYLVRSKENGKRFAVKAFEKQGPNSLKKASLLNEIELLRSLDHENIIKLYEVYESKGSIYLVLELAEGRSLQAIMNDHSFAHDFPEEKVIPILRSTLEGLSYLASHGIMHRDLKPENIIFNEKTNEVKIIDFDLATKIDVSENLFKGCGSPGYIAPEVMNYDENDSDSSYNDRCDVFSAGCIFFHMLLKNPLFDEQDASITLKQNKDQSFLKGIKYMIKNLVNVTDLKINTQGLDLLQKLLEFDQNKRYSACNALSHPYIKPVTIPIRTRRIKLTKLLLLESLERFDASKNSTPVSTISNVGTIILNEKTDFFKTCISSVSLKKTEKLEFNSPRSSTNNCSTGTNTPTSVPSKSPVFPSVSLFSPEKGVTTPKAPRNRRRCVTKNPIWSISENKEDELKEEEKSKEEQIQRRIEFLPSIKPVRSPRYLSMISSIPK